MIRDMNAPAIDSLPGLATAQLSQRTGVAPATLRMWETRHGFPRPQRLPGGHRRYSEQDVERVLAVLQARREGLSLAAAIARAQVAAALPDVSSIYAPLAARAPHLQPMTLAKPAMLALTRAIEDEYCAHASGGVLVGSFQAVRFYRQSQRRWRELARTAALAVALADFSELRRPAAAPIEVPVDRSHPLAREWAIAFHAPGASACLAGWEIPQVNVPHQRDRVFEVVWSPEPQVARMAIEAAAHGIRALAPQMADALVGALAPAAPSDPELRAAVAQAQRMLSRLAGVRE